MQIFVLPDRNEIIYLADLYSGMFVVVAAVAGISMCLQGTTFTTAGLRMTTRLRKQYFTALLSQVYYFTRLHRPCGDVPTPIHPMDVVTKLAENHACKEKQILKQTLYQTVWSVGYNGPKLHFLGEIYIQ